MPSGRRMAGHRRRIFVGLAVGTALALLGWLVVDAVHRPRPTPGSSSSTLVGGSGRHRVAGRGSRSTRRASSATAPAGSKIDTGTLAQIAASPLSVTNPADQLSSAQQAFLREVAGRTWSFFSGPDVDPVTHLPRNNVVAANSSGRADNEDYTSPTEIGLYLTSIVAARDLDLISAQTALQDASELLAELQKLQQADGMPLRWYDTSTGAAIAAPKGGSVSGGGFLSSVDDAWYAQGLMVAQQAFPELSLQFGSLLEQMQFQIFYDPAKDVLYNGYDVGKGPTASTYDLAYGGTRIADYMAIASGKVPGRLWWGLRRVPSQTTRQRQNPVGQTVTYTDPQDHQSYTVFEGHYTYQGIRFVPTFAGSMFQALAPDMVFPEQELAPRSLGANDRNTALAQEAYGLAGLGLPVWGWAPASTPQRLAGYAQYGAPDLAAKAGSVPDSAVAPYAAFMALPLIPQEAYADIATMVQHWPGIFTSYGFLDSVEPSTGTLAGRYMAVSQAMILMALDNALNDYRLQRYTAQSPFLSRLAPYFPLEDFGLTGPG